MRKTIMVKIPKFMKSSADNLKTFCNAKPILTCDGDVYYGFKSEYDTLDLSRDIIVMDGMKYIKYSTLNPIPLRNRLKKFSIDCYIVNDSELVFRHYEYEKFLRVLLTQGNLDMSSILCDVKVPNYVYMNKSILTFNKPNNNNNSSIVSVRKNPISGLIMNPKPSIYMSIRRFVSTVDLDITKDVNYNYVNDRGTWQGAWILDCVMYGKWLDNIYIPIDYTRKDWVTAEELKGVMNDIDIKKICDRLEID